MNKCHKCKTAFEPSSLAKHCPNCGEERLNSSVIDGIFKAMVGKRALMRKLDLPKVVRLLGTLLEALSGTAPRIRGIVGVVQHAFEEVLQAQLSEGQKSTQGIA